MKKLCALLLAALLAVSLLAGCKPGGPAGPVEYTGEMVEDGNTYADPNWLPVVKEPITLTATINDNQTVGDYNARTLWAEIAEKTGVTIKLRLLVSTGGETETLMFASRDFPDFSFRLLSLPLVHEACLAGDIIELDEEMLQTYAPNWYDTLQQYPDMAMLSLHSDGKRYSLPQMIMEESSYMLRDLHIINANWLDELGMKTPETLDEFTDYLRAVKAGAGTGSIPTNVVPLYVRNYTNIGSYYSFLDMFGIYQGFNTEVVVDGKTVVNNAQNVAVKAPLKYLSQLYSEQLIAKNFTSYTWETYQAAQNSAGTSTEPWFVGSMFTYGVSEDFLVCLPPLKVSDDITPVTRDMGLEVRMIRDSFFIFANNKYPIATLRMIDTYATPEGAIRAVIGTAGENSTYIITEDGKYLYNPNKELIVADTEKGWNDHGPGIVGPDIVEQLVAEDMKDPRSRVYWYHTLYKGTLPENKQMFPQAALAYLTQEENAEITTIHTSVNSNIRSYTTRWIQGQGDIDAEWDAFQQKLVDLGLNRKLELYQKAWDMYSAALK